MQTAAERVTELEALVKSLSTDKVGVCPDERLLACSSSRCGTTDDRPCRARLDALVGTPLRQDVSADDEGMSRRLASVRSGSRRNSMFRAWSYKLKLLQLRGIADVICFLDAGVADVTQCGTGGLFAATADGAARAAGHRGGAGRRPRGLARSCAPSCSRTRTVAVE